MTEPTSIERIVMRRVHRIRILRAVFSSGTAAALVCVLALWGIGREVWVAKVFANGPQDFLGHTRYLAYAFGHTRVVVQALTLATFAAVLTLARAAAQTLSHAVRPRFA